MTALRVLKSYDRPAEDIAAVTRDDLEEFPDRVHAALQFPLGPEPAGEEECQPEFDPDAIRQAVLDEAREEAVRLVQEAYDEGLRRGMDAGQREFEASLAQCTEALNAAAEAMAQARADFLETLEPQVLEIALLIGRRVLQRELRMDPEVVLGTVRRSLAALTDRQRLRVRVNPADLEALRQHEVTLIEEFTGVEQLEIEGVDDIAPGGCEVHSETMLVDARIETLLAEVLNELDGA